MIKLGKDVHIQPDNARVVIRRDKLVLSIDPFLTIESRSPDRSWTILANPEDNKRTPRRFVGSTKEPNRVHLQYKDEGDSMLDVTGRDGGVELEARSKVTQPIYTHLNQYAGVVVHGHKKLTFTLSPIPNRRFEIPRPSAPRRFAYLDREQKLFLVDADKDEKGPFHELASGPLKRGEPLVLTLYDGETAAFRISLDDWTAGLHRALPVGRLVGADERHRALSWRRSGRRSGPDLVQPGLDEHRPWLSKRGLHSRHVPQPHDDHEVSMKRFILSGAGALGT